MGEVVVFHSLGEAHIANIARIQLHYLEKCVAQMDMKLEVSEAAMLQLAKEGFDLVFGARLLKRATQHRIENPLAKEILSGRFAPKDIIRVDVVDGRIEFQQVMEAEVV
ncbi:MAG: ATP-dependent Clp protease ATP-binding subunit ClpB [bacterium]|nr:MAG: ATP-dependent Clp protease ATP-binding subunit ClpB [bacterium]KAF0150054.1 MAG: ATP-dependent Clp protease ATP-binding subunit ClpB [bacterium]KAF0169162.1 MAG: ATP-dependent Clp protease ATP-binding subunit ClpB [bacterium]